MESLVLLLVLLLLIVGLAGSVLPVLPGILLLFAAALLHALASGGEPIGIGRLVALGLLGAVASVLDYAAGLLGVKRAGGSRWAVLGAVCGGLVGLFFVPVGLILGPILGAVGGELIWRREIGPSIRAGIGTAIGILVGTGARLAIAVSMAGLILWWLWRG